MKANGHANRHAPPTVLEAAAESPKHDHVARLVAGELDRLGGDVGRRHLVVLRQHLGEGGEPGRHGVHQQHVGALVGVANDLGAGCRRCQPRLQRIRQAPHVDRQRAEEVAQLGVSEVGLDAALLELGAGIAKRPPKRGQMSLCGDGQGGHA